MIDGYILFFNFLLSLLPVLFRTIRRFAPFLRAFLPIFRPGERMCLTLPQCLH